MAWYEIFIVSVGLSLDVFTYALYKGAMLSRLDKKQILKMILLFTGWQRQCNAIRKPDFGTSVHCHELSADRKTVQGGIGSYFFLIAIWLIVGHYICGTRWNAGKMYSPGDSYAFGPCLPVWTVF